MYKRQADTVTCAEPAASAPALMSLDTPPYITDELAHLLATNQADSIMGSFGIARSEACSTVQAVFDVSDYSGPVSYTHLDVYKRQVLCLLCSW